VEKDLKEIPKKVRAAMNIRLVDHMDDVLREALVSPERDAPFVRSSAGSAGSDPQPQA
jgi:ATP-dependent Lon protease